MYVDRNMADEPFFRIAAEENRGVFVPAESINAANGATDWMKGRKTNRVGRVLELISDGRINQFAFVVDGTWRYFKDGEVSLSYTWNDSKDDGNPVKQVVVTNGTDFTSTNDQGEYLLPAGTSQSRFVYISVPSDYQIPETNGISDGSHSFTLTKRVQPSTFRSGKLFVQCRQRTYYHPEKPGLRRQQEIYRTSG